MFYQSLKCEDGVPLMWKKKQFALQNAGKDKGLS